MTTKKTKVTMQVTLDKDVVDFIDKERGRLVFSEWLNNMLAYLFFEEEEKKGYA